MSHEKRAQTMYEETFKRNQALEEVVAQLKKAARSALVTTNAWQQEFNDNEILAVIAMYQASKTVLAQKEKALGIAIAYIGELEDFDNIDVSSMAIETLEEINQALVNETIQQSINKKGENSEIIQMS